jgi:gas vesicle protein
MSKSNNTLIGLLAGTAIGATLGVLFAPDKGTNTRQRIADEAIAAKDKIADTAIDLKERVISTTNSKKESLEEQMDTLVSDASYKAEDVIGTLERKLKDLKEKNKKLQKTS